MNPGLVVKLRPTGPWRIGPDSGARNQVDVIYHSDSLYAGVTAALARFGWLEDWLNATARNGAPAVSFSSCFPFVDEIGFVVPPRTVWPPTSPALLSARVRWKSARFVPLGIVPALLAGHALDENQWAVDGSSGCLVPNGRPGPFRMGMRSNSAVDRMTGNTERHSTACLEFRPGAGLWTVVSFADEAAYARWLEPVKTAFRLLADSGFGGERSRGWGRAEAPEFTEGVLPDMILGAGGQEPQGAKAEVGDQGSAVQDRETGDGHQGLRVGEEVPAPPIASQTQSEDAPSEPTGAADVPALDPQSPTSDLVPDPQSLAADAAHESASSPESPPPEPQPPTPALVPDPQPLAPEAGPQPPAPAAAPGPHWLLSLFAPSPADSVAWDRGNYAVVERSGRIESAARFGELKKQLPMIAEGSVLFAANGLRGSAPDVAPDGFAHPVFRAGFAVAIPLPEVG